MLDLNSQRTNPGGAWLKHNFNTFLQKQQQHKSSLEFSLKENGGVSTKLSQCSHFDKRIRKRSIKA